MSFFISKGYRPWTALSRIQRSEAFVKYFVNVYTANMNLKFIDIAVNLADEMYQGIYHGKKKHEDDLDDVIRRSWKAGLDKIVVTGTNLSDSKTAIEMCNKNENLYCTVGCHPTRCNEFEMESTTPEEYLEDLLNLAQSNPKTVIAIGECGLDFDRTNFCGIEVQKKYFERQISLAEVTGLPMFLHCRKAATELAEILSKHRENISGGVVHSFDGTRDELQLLLDLDMYIGINGCSLKTEENLKVAAEIPLGRLMIETDAPWCEMKPSHAGYKYIQTKFISKKYDKWEKGIMVKGRNEPQCITQVFEVLSAIREEDPQVLADKIHENTCKLFLFKPNERVTEV